MEILSLLLWSLILLVPAVYLYYRKLTSYWKERGVPYVEPTAIKHIRNFSFEAYKRKGEFPFIGTYLFVKPVAMALDLDFIKNILIRDFDHFTDRGVYHNEVDDPLTGDLFSADGQKWRILRNKLSPTFTSGRMKFMYPTVVKVAERFNQTLAELVKDKTMLEIKDLLARFTTDVIGTCAFGIECNSLQDPDAEFRKYGRKHFEVPLHGNIVFQLMLSFPNLARKLHMKIIHDDVTKFFMGIVRETVDFREKNNIRRNDFMDLLIQIKNHAKLDGDDSETSKIIGNLTFEELAAQVFVFFLGGFETSSSTLTFTLYEMALNPDIQEKCRGEIESVLKKYNGELTYEAVNDMKYIDQTILETLRKYPILPVNFRNCVADYKVPGTNVVIEKGKNVHIPVHAIQHDPEYYPEPEKFDPDRFLPENVKSRHPMAFLSFGDGPRNCVGLRFGKMQSRIGLITLLKNYRITKSPKTPIPLVYSMIHFILTPEAGMYLNFEKL